MVRLYAYDAETSFPKRTVYNGTDEKPRNQIYAGIGVFTSGTAGICAGPEYKGLESDAGMAAGQQCGGTVVCSENTVHC